MLTCFLMLWGSSHSINTRMQMLAWYLAVVSFFTRQRNTNTKEMSYGAVVTTTIIIIIITTLLPSNIEKSKHASLKQHFVGTRKYVSVLKHNLHNLHTTDLTSITTKNYHSYITLNYPFEQIPNSTPVNLFFLFHFLVLNRNVKCFFHV